LNEFYVKSESASKLVVNKSNGYTRLANLKQHVKDSINLNDENVQLEENEPLNGTNTSNRFL